MKHAVTGAFGFSVKYIARKLIEKQIDLITLTNSPGRKSDINASVKAVPFNFGRPDELARSLEGTEILYNTYWVRFNSPLFKHSEAVQNTLILFEAAAKAGVKRIVHTSITNPSVDSELEYFSGKALLEEALMASGISYAILRPAVLFGEEDILINNIAWMVRKFPFFGTFGNGNDYGLQPIFVGDFADMAVKAAFDSSDYIADAVGPESFTYSELVQTVSKIVTGKRKPIIGLTDSLGYLASRITGLFTGDNPVTREEIKGLKAVLLRTDSIPLGTTRLSDWLRANKETVGLHYASEMRRRKNRNAEY